MKFFTCYGQSHSKEKQYAFPGNQKAAAIRRMIIMRINCIALFLLVAIMNVCASVHAQKIDLSFRQTPLKQVLAEIQKQSGYRVAYNNKHLAKSHAVTFTIKNGELKEILEKCFEGQPLTYDIIEKTIVVKPKPKEEIIFDKVNNYIRRLKVSGTVSDEKGQPLSGVTVRLKGTNVTAITTSNGNYAIDVPDGNAVLQFSFIGYRTVEQVVGQNSIVNITLKEAIANLEEIGVVSTGYQTIPKERVTGSFVVLDSTLVNRKVSANILERLDGITSGLLFNGTADKRISPVGYDQKNLGINVRGQSSIYASTNPLIVVDNFPYEGDINNINPNDIATITILKDAAAASIWGANAANGVIVITTKKGKLGEKLNVDINTNLSVVNKPDIFKDRGFLSPGDYLDAEKILFDNGYYDSDLADNFSMTPVTPGIATYSALRSGQLTQEQADRRIAELNEYDVRKDLDKYSYRNAVQQQYALSLKGGTDNFSYFFSTGYDHNEENLNRNYRRRLTVNSFNTYIPVKNLELSTAINYSRNDDATNNNLSMLGLRTIGLGNFKNFYLYPYAQLADETGNHLAVANSLKPEYITQMEQKGLLDWSLRPLDELALADNTTKMNDLLLRFMGKYKILPQLNIEVQYQHERQQIDNRIFRGQGSYYVRNLINQFTQVDASTGKLTYNFPQGAYLNLGNYDWYGNNGRAQINFNHVFSRHSVHALAGAELRERRTEGLERISYGYDEQFGTSVDNLNYNIAYPVNPSGGRFIDSPIGSVSGSLNRYLSQYLNASYTYDSRYILTLSGRRDGANIFGVKTNDKITPLWSAGLGWNISKEKFYKVDWLPELKVRATYGYNGNVYFGSAYLSGRYSVASITGVPTIYVDTPPNPALRWEKVQNINVGIDFSSKNNRINGTIELYQKNGRELIQPTSIAAQTGFATVMANTAKTKSRGLDLSLQSNNTTGEFKWSSTLLLSLFKDRLEKFEAPQTTGSIQNFGGISGIVGGPLYGVYSYRSMGLDPVNGDPQGYLNGKISKDYAAILNNFKPDSLVFSGSARPTKFGAFRNDFSFKGISMSVNVVFKLGYVFRRPSTPINYSTAVESNPNQDFSMRWQKTGDESSTFVPSVVYALNRNRNTFYTYSDALIEDGSHIRLQDIRIGYQLPKRLLGEAAFKNVQLYSYLNNLGIIWKKGKSDIDPDTFGVGTTASFSIAFGLNAKF